MLICSFLAFEKPTLPFETSTNVTTEKELKKKETENFRIVSKSVLYRIFFDFTVDFWKSIRYEWKWYNNMSFGSMLDDEDSIMSYMMW